MSTCRIFSCVVGRGCLLWPVRSLGKTLSLCPASFCTPRPNLPVTPGVSWLPTFAFQSPIVKVKVGQLCPTLCNPMDCIVYGILQARILEWVAFPFSRGSSQPRDRTQVSRIAGGFLTSWATREAQIHLASLTIVKWKSLSYIQLFTTPWTIQSMEFSGLWYWSG